MKPYKNICSKNLGLLLLLARLTTVVGFVLLVAFIVALVLPFIGLNVPISSVFPLIPISVGMLIVSGVVAAVVSLEDNYRKRTEHILSSNEI